MEDALMKLDKLTNEEAQMAVAQNLKATHNVDRRVGGVANTVEAIDSRVAGMEDRVATVDDKISRVDDKVVGINDRVARVDDRVRAVDNKVSEVIDGTQLQFKIIVKEKPELLRRKRNKGIHTTSSQRPRSNETFVFSCLHQYREALRIPFQEINCGRAFTNGSPHQTHQGTITSHVVLITRKQRTGFSKAEHIRNGSQMVRFSGSMENVRPVPLPSRYSLMASCNVAGSGKSVLWFVDSYLFY